MAIETLIWLIPLPPLLAFFMIVLFTHRSRALSHWLALIGAGLAWLASMIIFFNVIGIEDLADHPLSVGAELAAHRAKLTADWGSGRPTDGNFIYSSWPGPYS